MYKSMQIFRKRKILAMLSARAFLWLLQKLVSLDQILNIYLRLKTENFIKKMERSVYKQYCLLEEFV